jgi:hypothetical protein
MVSNSSRNYGDIRPHSLVQPVARFTGGQALKNMLKVSVLTLLMVAIKRLGCHIGARCHDSLPVVIVEEPGCLVIEVEQSRDNARLEQDRLSREGG